jgi:hypothetical protein
MPRPRGANRFSEAEISWAVRAVLKGGGKPTRITVEPGKATVDCGNAGEPDDKPEDLVELLK